MSLLRHHLALGFTLFQKAPGLLDRVQTTAGGWEKRRQREGAKERGNVACPHFCPHFFWEDGSSILDTQKGKGCSHGVQAWIGMGGIQRAPP